MNTKTLTIVIPCYNVEKYIQETLDSIMKCNKLDQIEVIAVNDGSRDNTKDILESNKSSFPSLLIVDKENGGHGSTINTGLDKAKGRYFCVIDGDDWIEPTVMDELVSFLSDNESDLVITGHTRNYINTNTSEEFGYKESKGFVCGVNYLNEHGMRIPMTDICYKTSLLKSVNLRIQEKTFYVDEEYCTIPFTKIETISFFSRGYYHYRIGESGQSISPMNTLKNVDSRERVLMRLIEFIGDDRVRNDNSVYIKNKIIGLTKTILEIYYIKDPNRREGAKKGASFYNLIKHKCRIISDECKTYKTCVTMLNVLPGGRNIYSAIEKKKRESR